MWQGDFVAIDTECVQSYLNQEYRTSCKLLSRDLGGYVKIVDASFDPSSSQQQQVIREQAPGYNGCHKVLGSVLWDDVYPLLASLAIRPWSFWSLSVLHPTRVYTGTPITRQEDIWEAFQSAQSELLSKLKDLSLTPRET
jgi:hypothetical protein